MLGGKRVQSAQPSSRVFPSRSIESPKARAGRVFHEFPGTQQSRPTCVLEREGRLLYKCVCVCVCVYVYVCVIHPSFLFFLCVCIHNVLCGRIVSDYTGHKDT